MPTQNFALQYPLSAELNLPVVHAGPGFDERDVRAALGEDRMARLMAYVTKHSAVFCCAHAHYPDKHPLAGYEVHCIYLKDLEDFLKAGG